MLSLFSLLTRLFVLNCTMNTQSLLDILRVELARSLVKEQSVAQQQDAAGFTANGRIEGLAPPAKTVASGVIGFRT
jgi:hypothetical protein